MSKIIEKNWKVLKSGQSYLKGNSSHCRFTGRDLIMEDFRDINLEITSEGANNK